MKPKIIVIYHSGYGHTEKQAQAVAKGAGAELMKATEPDWVKLEAADAIIFGCPTYMGSASAPFKKFMDDSSKTWFAQKWKDKIAGGFTNGAGMSGDKLSTLIQFAVFAGQHGMIWVNAGFTPGDRFGGGLGKMAQSIDAPADEENPPKIDLANAESYGKRVAEITMKFKAR